MGFFGWDEQAYPSGETMTDSTAKKESWIDCLLAIEVAEFPEQKIPESSLLLAFMNAFKREAAPAETRSLSQLFIEELRKILADPQPPATHDIILATQKAIQELNEIGKSKEALLLAFPLNMLQDKLARDANNN